LERPTDLELRQLHTQGSQPKNCRKLGHKLSTKPLAKCRFPQALRRH